MNVSYRSEEAAARLEELAQRVRTGETVLMQLTEVDLPEEKIGATDGFWEFGRRQLVILHTATAPRGSVTAHSPA